MVHALEIVHHLLHPNGDVIDIRPSSDPPPIIVRSELGDITVGWLQETDDYIEYVQAGQAIEEAVGRGWFKVKQEDEFIYIIHAGNLAELRDFLAEEWHDAVIPPDARTEIEALYQDDTIVREIVIPERILIARYTKSSQSEVEDYH